MPFPVCKHGIKREGFIENCQNELQGWSFKNTFNCSSHSLKSQKKIKYQGTIKPPISHHFFSPLPCPCRRRRQWIRKHTWRSRNPKGSEPDPSHEKLWPSSHSRPNTPRCPPEQEIIQGRGGAPQTWFKSKNLGRILNRQKKIGPSWWWLSPWTSCAQNRTSKGTACNPNPWRGR